MGGEQTPQQRRRAGVEAREKDDEGRVRRERLLVRSVIGQHGLREQLDIALVAADAEDGGSGASVGGTMNPSREAPAGPFAFLFCLPFCLGLGLGLAAEPPVPAPPV